MFKRSFLAGFHSLGTFLTLLFSSKLHLENERKGTIYNLPGYGEYTVFRETVCDEKPNDNPNVLVVGFRLRCIGYLPFLHWLFQRMCILTTPFWSGFQGFHIKLWMVNEKTKNYVGIYEWYGRRNVFTYVELLLPVLRFFSVKGSVWYVTYEDIKLRTFLHSLQHP